jgi:sugar-specific transcriptional regulator TrmB
MGQEKVFNILTGLGLSRDDIKIYIFLAKKGPKVGRELSETLNINQRKTYASLKKLQRANLVTVKSERVALYLAIPFEKALDSVTELRIREATQMQFDRKALLDQPNQK